MERDRWIQIVDALSETERDAYYSDYLRRTLFLKYSCRIWENTPRPRGTGPPDKAYLGIGFWYLWKDEKVMSWVEFNSPSNVKITDIGENWKERGFARRHHVQTNGIYSFPPCWSAAHDQAWSEYVASKKCSTSA